MKAIVRNRDNRILWINEAGYGSLHINSADVSVIEIPSQDVSHLFSETSTGTVIREAYYPRDIMVFGLKTQRNMIDRDTGQAIDEAIHPFAGVEEQIGILRAQIAEILVALGLEPTDEFAKLNVIAAEKIQEGRKKKEALNAENS